MNCEIHNNTVKSKICYNNSCFDNICEKCKDLHKENCHPKVSNIK